MLCPKWMRYLCLHVRVCVICMLNKHNKWKTVFFMMAGKTRDTTEIIFVNQRFQAFGFICLVFVQIIKRCKRVHTASVCKIYGELVNLLLLSIKSDISFRNIFMIWTLFLHFSGWNCMKFIFSVIMKQCWAA